jgi:hypothetical protein
MSKADQNHHQEYASSYVVFAKTMNLHEHNRVARLVCYFAYFLSLSEPQYRYNATKSEIALFHVEVFYRSKNVSNKS